MKDLELTFGEIFKNDFGAFFKQLLDIQKFRQNREDSEKWVANLRFLDVSGVPPLQSLNVSDVPPFHQSEEERPTKRRRTDSGPGINPTSSGGSKPLTNIPVIQKELGKDQYVAVSWRWPEGKKAPLPYGYTEKTSFAYQIQRHGQEPHKSEFPDHYLERVIRYAQSVKVPNIWIDMESIFQRESDDPRDRELGVQIMDVVYGFSSHPVALLTTTLICQDEIDTLCDLISRRMFLEPTDTTSPQLEPSVKQLEVQMLILRILSDPRWSRGWIFQEDHISSYKMYLLIPYREHLKKDEKWFGKTLGELQVNLAKFKKAATMLCIASGDVLRWPSSEIMGKLKQYNIWNKRLHGSTSSTASSSSDLTQQFHENATLSAGGIKSAAITLYPSTTSSLLEDICNRNLGKEEDRVAILANAAKFPVRLDISSKSPLVTSHNFSLSTAMLALLLLNGEIFATCMVKDPTPILEHTLRSFLKEYQCLFHAPCAKFQQSFIDRCRLNPPRITEHGMETQGYLFEMMPRLGLYDLKLTYKEKEIFEPPPESFKTGQRPVHRQLRAVEEIAIVILMIKLQRYPGCTLGDYLVRYLAYDRNPPMDYNQSPPKRKSNSRFVRDVLAMMSAVASALIDGREIRLAKLAGQENNIPSAIFIPSLHQNHPDTSHHNEAKDGRKEPRVFTSRHNGWKGSEIMSMESRASLEVAVQEDQEIQKGNQSYRQSLRILGGINGVWDVNGVGPSTYTFPLPGNTDQRHLLTISKG